MRISDWSSDVCSSDLARGVVIGIVGAIQVELVVDRRLLFDRLHGRQLRLLAPFGAGRIVVTRTVLLRGCIELRARRQWQRAPVVRLSLGWLFEPRRRQHALLDAPILELARLLTVDRRSAELGSAAGVESGCNCG